MRVLLTLALLWALAFSEAIAEVTLNVTGVSEELAESISLSVIPPVNDSERALNRYLDEIPKVAKNNLAALGYFSPRIQVSRDVAEDTTIVTMNIEPGDPVRINKIDLFVDGPARLDPQFMPIMGKLQFQKNAVFESSNYEASKSILLDAAQDTGYFDFEFTTSKVRVSRNNLTADIELKAESGVRYTFGQIRFNNTIFTESFLRRWATFAEGDPYESSKIAELTQNLQNSGYFQSVRVTPQRDRRYGKTVPVTVRVITKDNNQVGVGIGYATDTGVRTKLTWAKPLINRHGHSLESELGISAVRQNVSFSYRIPRSNNPLHNYWGVQYGLQNEENEDTESFLSTLEFGHTRLMDSDWTETLFLRWERERSIIADDELNTDLILPGFVYARSRSKGKPFLTWGQSTSFTAMYGDRNIGSTIDFLKLNLRFKYIKALDERNSYLFRLQYGAIESNDFTLVPTSQRFFAGGDTTIRGYKYNSISPTNPDGDAVGGRYLEVTSLEYNYRFAERWSVAAFLDAGRAFNNFDTAYSVGGGFGIRWQSPVGPFRLDLAEPIDDERFNDVRLHISLGPEL
ncbi:MAG: autotransporter assembly complex protein TamA [Gammaproteobacteria bacterium]|nr:autotransporter assembly complex protein TamA [Gammaproteobacteria bacterium]